MQLPDYSKRGWLVVDENGLVAYAGGDSQIVVDDGMLSKRVLDLQVGAKGVLSDVLASICLGRMENAEGRADLYASVGERVQLVWSARAATSRDGKRAVFLEIETGSIEGESKAQFGDGIDRRGFEAAQRELHSSREQFRRLVECVNVVPWEADADTGRLRYVGPQAQELLKFPLGDWFKPGFWSDRLHPSDRDWVEIVRDDAIKNHGRFESEYRLLDAEGEVVWVRDIASVNEAANGERIVGGYLHNITHRRAAEEALRRNQDFIEQIANASPLIWYVLDLEKNQISYLHGGGIRMLGFSRTELLRMGQNFFLELAPPEDLPAHKEHFQRLTRIGKGQHVEREFPMRAAGNAAVWVRTHEAALTISVNGRVQQVVGVAEDITIQRAAAESLAGSEAMFRRLAETTRVIPFELDLASIRFKYIGPQAGEQLGIDSSEWLEPGFWSRVVHPEDRPMAEERLLALVCKPDGHQELELRLCDNAGAYQWYRQVLRSEVSEAGRLIGRGYFLNISISKSLEHEREESRRQLRELDMENQRVREEERLAMSREIHDELGQALTLLRFDLTWIRSRLSKLLPDGTGEPVTEKIQEMDADIGETLQIVRRITTQLRPPLLDEFGLADAIEWQAKDFSRRAGIRCDVSAQPVVFGCKDTASVVFRIFQELLTNVGRHSKASRIRVSLKQIDGVVQLSVSDNGCGFELEGKRTGFGLLGMRERTEMLRGSLKIKAAIGRGTTVILSVPGEPCPNEGTSFH